MISPWQIARVPQQTGADPSHGAALVPRVSPFAPRKDRAFFRAGGHRVTLVSRSPVGMPSATLRVVSALVRRAPQARPPKHPRMFTLAVSRHRVCSNGRPPPSRCCNGPQCPQPVRWFSRATRHATALSWMAARQGDRSGHFVFRQGPFLQVDCRTPSREPKRTSMISGLTGCFATPKSFLSIFAFVHVDFI